MTDIITRGYSLELSSFPPQKFMLNKPSNPVVLELVEDFIRKHALEGVPDQEKFQGLYSPIFPVPKASGGWRLVIDLSYLNQFFVKHKFRMESIRSAIANVERGDFLASVDLQDAYLHIPILRAHRKYLRIALLLDHQILHFQFTCLPFGITSAPRVFTKVVVVLTAALRLQGICVTPYLDDWLVRGPSEAVLKQHLHKTLQMLDTHGFLVNLKKSSLDPTPVISYLGFTIDTFLMKLSLSDQRTTNLQRAVQGLLQTDHCSVRKAMRILGMMTSSLEAVPWARAHFRMQQNCILTQWDKSRDSLERNINISLPVKKDLLWWLHPQRFLQGRSLKTQIQTVLTSDASGSAWGAHVEDHWVQEAWSQKELQMSSNLKELMAIRKALIHFKSKVLHKAVQVQSDNLAAVFYLNKQGGTQSPSMQKECALIMR